MSAVESTHLVHNEQTSCEAVEYDFGQKNTQD